MPPYTRTLWALLRFGRMHVQRGFCPATGSIFSSAQRGNRGGLLFESTPWLLQRLLLVLKKDGSLRPILDLRRLNYSLYRGKFRILTLKSILFQVQAPLGPVSSRSTFQNAYFHFQVVQRQRKFLRFAFGGKGLPIQGYSLWASSGPKDIHQSNWL